MDPSPSTGPGAAHQITFVMWSINRIGGMERATLQLARQVALRIPVAIVVGKMSPAAAMLVEREVPACTLSVGVGRVLQTTQVRRRRNEVVVVVGVFTIARLSWLPSRRGLRPLLWEHSLTVDRLGRVRRMRVLARLARRSYRRSTVVCPSRAVAAALEQLGAAALTVIPNIAERHRVAARPARRPTGKVRIGFVGRLEAVRSPLIALDVLEHLDLRFTLEVFGDGSAMPMMQSEAHRRGLHPRLTLHGWIEDQLAIMAGVDVLLSLSKSETFGYSLVEAADAHVPVVALDVGAVSEMVPAHVPGLILAVDSSPRDIAAAVERLADDGPTAEEFAAADASRQRAFSSSTVTDAWLRLFSVIEARGAPSP